jgi:signal peptidase II
MDTAPMTHDAKRPGFTAHLMTFFALAIVGQNLDLITKEAAEQHVRGAGTQEFVPGLIQFEWTENKGIVFGIGPEWSKVFLVVSVLAAPLIVMIFLSVKQPRWITTVSLGLILAGTLGNMFDRLTVGAVRDFIKVHESLFSFPLFNLADSFICVGVFLMVLDILIFEPRFKKRLAAAHETNPVAPQAAQPESR